MKQPVTSATTTIMAVFLLMSPANPLRAQGPAIVHDVVVYGGTSAGVIAAIQATKMGKSAILVCPDRHLGGLTSGGLGWTDSGKKETVGGLSREFYHRVWRHYQHAAAWKWEDQKKFGNRNQSPAGANGDGATMWVFEPHVAEQIYEAWLQEQKITVARDRWLNRKPGEGVQMKNGRITAITMLSGESYRGKMFIDATYEGDLLAAAGVDYHVGREANDVYGETWNGIQVGVLHHRHWFMAPIDPYKTPGDPSSGVLPRVSTDPPGNRGDGDRRIQAYCFRMCLTNVAENRIPFAKPDGYDPSQYELLSRVYAAGWRETFQKFDPMPNHKTDTNNHGPFSTDNIGMNYDYPDASYERRREIIREHEVYQQGLMYFIANDPSVPADVREAMSRWGLCKDEFQDNNGWPHQLYVREARRMIGQYVMTEHDCLDRKETPNSVGMGSYTLDSHNVQRYIKPDGKVQNEGDIGVRAPRPYEIAYGAIVPKRSQCRNLLSPVCVSSSHIAFGSIRMEPVFMVLGQSAATAACMSIDQAVAVQDLPYEQLSKRLLADKQVLEYEVAYEFDSRKLPGVVVDDRAATLKGDWPVSSTNKSFVNDGYRHNRNDATGACQAQFKTTLPAGTYEVRMSYSAASNRATNVAVTVQHAQGRRTATVNQKQRPNINGLFISLGTFAFNGDSAVTVDTRGANGHVIIDAVQWIRK